jgi:hypothetical protein
MFNCVYFQAILENQLVKSIRYLSDNNGIWKIGNAERKLLVQFNLIKIIVT